MDEKQFVYLFFLYAVAILPVNYLVWFNDYLTDKYSHLLRIIPNIISTT